MTATTATPHSRPWLAPSQSKFDASADQTAWDTQQRRRFVRDKCLSGHAQRHLAKTRVERRPMDEAWAQKRTHTVKLHANALLSKNTLSLFLKVKQIAKIMVLSEFLINKRNAIMNE
jgi:hypothetical protein